MKRKKIITFYINSISKIYHYKHSKSTSYTIKYFNTYKYISLKQISILYTYKNVCIYH